MYNEPVDYADFLRHRVETNYLAAALMVPEHTAVEFGPLEPFQGREAVDPLLLALLPSGQSSVDEKEARLLASLFREDGEMPAHRLN